MRSVSYRLVDLDKVRINLGFQGENEHTQILFDCKKAFEEYPGAVQSLAVVSPHGEKYPAVTTRDGNYVSWLVSDADTAYAGDGMLQLSFIQGEVVKKTYRAKTHIHESINADGNPPSGVGNWLDTANQTLEELPTTAKQYALSALDEMTVEAETLPEGSSPEVVKTVDPDTGAINLDFKIPAGGGGTSDYEDLENKPTLGGVTLDGEVSLQDIGAYEKPSSGIPAEDIAEGVIPNVTGKANLTVIAPAFNQATANDAGSFVTYTDGVVYLLPDGHTAGATWANTSKTATNIGAQVSRALTAIQGLDDEKYEKPSGGIPATDLTQAVQNSLGAANSAYQKPSGGIPASDIADDVIPVVDSALSDSSENAIQNKVVKGALDTKAPVIINTATGNPAVFNDGGGMPLKSLLIPFTPKQEGTGDTSPTNVRNIVPWNGLTVYQSGADTSNPTETDISFPSPVYGGTLDVVSGVLTVEWAGFSATWGDGDSATDMGEGITRKVFPMVDYLSTGVSNNKCNIAPYYSSELAITHFYYSGAGATNRKCRLFLPSYTPDSTEVTVITKLSQIYEIQLTPQEITALVGDNTIWSDADGSMIVEYPADTALFIANQHRNFIAPELSSMIADTALVKNDFRIVGNNLYKITSAIASGGTLTPNTNCVKTTLAEVIKPLLT